MKNYTIICDAPGLPLSKGSLKPAAWQQANEQLRSLRLRGGHMAERTHIVIPGTAVPTVRTGDFPYFLVRAGAQKDLT
ncbi:hypothetical protein LWC34_36380 [Kibdelosporangium philippinense]|uniref:Uncharacterized protein n=1 Tax=Kibdelosporangium philippinense TaxID=211113 RepID=A0ABS8ZKC6_9PSEU|nr:hypothetical protein [Kibdelosporangium philippinense]MCE7008254.1 hypothetical protein [Kibdelosporangium philippinense]